MLFLYSICTGQLLWAVCEVWKFLHKWSCIWSWFCGGVHLWAWLYAGAGRCYFRVRKWWKSTMEWDRTSLQRWFCVCDVSVCMTIDLQSNLYFIFWSFPPDLIFVFTCHEVDMKSKYLFTPKHWFTCLYKPLTLYFCPYDESRSAKIFVVLWRRN